MGRGESDVLACRFTSCGRQAAYWDGCRVWAPSCNGGHLFRGWYPPAGLPAPPDAADEVALERPSRLPRGAAFLLASRQVGLGRLIDTRLGHRDLMKKPIQPAVAKPIESMPGAPGAGGLQR
jgi:hypothetical protein